VNALVITFREGIEAALVVGIMLAYLSKSGRPTLGRWVIAGTVAAGLFSVGVAGVLTATHVGADNPLVEGVLQFVAAVAVITMVWWMWRNGRRMGETVRSRVSGIIGSDVSGARVGIGLFLFAFLMVAREGVETVLFLSAALLGGIGGTGVMVGGLAGLGLAIAYGVLFAPGSARIDLRLFFTLTSIVLLLLAVKLVGGGIHEFEEAGIIPMSESMAHVFDWFAENSAINWLFLAALLVPLAVPFLRRHTPSGRRSAQGV